VSGVRACGIVRIVRFFAILGSFDACLPAGYPPFASS
jgi:hypothetical protein